MKVRFRQQTAEATFLGVIKFIAIIFSTIFKGTSSWSIGQTWSWNLLSKHPARTHAAEGKYFTTNTWLRIFVLGQKSPEHRQRPHNLETLCSCSLSTMASVTKEHGCMKRPWLYLLTLVIVVNIKGHVYCLNRSCISAPQNKQTIIQTFEQNLIVYSLS